MATIRPYRFEDRAELYEVCLRTGADGDDATSLYEIPTLLGEVYVGPYLEFAPQLAWVAELEGRAAGYVLATADSRAFEAECEKNWWPNLRERYPLGTFPADSHDEEVVGLIHAPPIAASEAVTDYPAHLHIDLSPELQGHGVGSRLIGQLLDSLRERHVSGVHLGVSRSNERAIGFYEHLGFRELVTDRPDPGASIMGLAL